MSSGFPPDEYVAEQIGGGRRSTSPVIETPTRLRTRIKATARDSGLVRGAQGRRAKLSDAADAGLLRPPADPQCNAQTTSRTLHQSPESCYSSAPAPRSRSPQAANTPGSRVLNRQTLGVPAHTICTQSPSDSSEHRRLSPAPGPRNGLSYMVRTPPSPVFNEESFVFPREPSPPLPPSAVSCKAPSIATSHGPSVTLNTEHSAHQKASSPPHHPSMAPPADPRLPHDPCLSIASDSRVGSDGIVGSDPIEESSEESSMTARPIPTMKIIPPTPFSASSVPRAPKGGIGLVAVESTGTAPFEPNGQIHAEPDLPSDGPEPPSPSLPSTPMNGRRSHRVLQLLQDGYEEMEIILERVAEETMMTTQQVAEAWHRDRGRIINGSNYWNKYQAYWKSNEAAERARAGVEEAEPATPSVMSRCYKRFVIDQGDVWKETLDVFELTEVTKTSEHTLAQRAQLFHNIRRKVCGIMDSAAAKYGFQSALVICGNIVNEDNAFGNVHTTRGAVNFWKVRCKADDDTIIGHFKSHVYHLASLDIVEDAFPDDEQDCTMGNGGVPLSQRRVEAGRPAEAEVFDKDLSNHTTTLKTCLTQEIKKSGADVSKLVSKNFPWKTLLTVLASAGLVMEGYPFDTLMPGECRNNRTKGISDLKLPEVKGLICAIRAGTLTIRRVKSSRETCKDSYRIYTGGKLMLPADLLGGISPVIVEEAPPPSSHRLRGRRMFATGQSDRRGPKRLNAEAVATRVKRSGTQKVNDSDSEDAHEGSVLRPKKRRAKVVVNDSDSEDAHEGSAPRAKKRRAEVVVPVSRKSKKVRKAASEESAEEGETSEEVPRKSSKRAGKLQKRGKGDKPTRRRKRTRTDARVVGIFSSDDDGGTVRPKPRLVRRNIPSEDDDSDLFKSTITAEVANPAVTATFRKKVPSPFGLASVSGSPSPKSSLLPNLGMQDFAPSYSSPLPLQAHISGPPIPPEVQQRPSVTPILPPPPLLPSASLAPLSSGVHLTAPTLTATSPPLSYTMPDLQPPVSLRPQPPGSHGNHPDHFHNRSLYNRSPTDYPTAATGSTNAANFDPCRAAAASYLHRGDPYSFASTCGEPTVTGWYHPQSTGAPSGDAADSLPRLPQPPSMDHP